MPTFTFYGTKAEILSDNYLQLKSVQPNVQATEFLALSVRSGDAKAETIHTADDDLVVMQMSNDVEWHYRADDFESFLKSKPGTNRGGKKGELEVPSFFASPGESRGDSGDIIKTKGLKIITGMVAKGAAQLLVNKMESGLASGLHGLNDKFEFIRFDAKTAEKNKPYLLFIHGTNSNTEGGFKELKTNGAYSKLFAFYGGRVLAFEHKTLSESPVKNVTDLLNTLPNEMVIDIVSHSRGGIVADLLARCSHGEKPFDNKEMAIINNNEDFKPLKNEATAANSAAATKKIDVRKMVRVACPAAGTVLIDSRMDNLVNVFCNLLKLIPGAAACMPFTLFLDFAKAVVHERTDISVFPGVAAQIPESPLLRLLNNPNRVIQSELFVISGDVERSGILKSLLVMSTNLYFGEAHDLVVNSNSMFRGTYRESLVKEHFEQQATVNHFNYFKNKPSQDALLAALIEPQKIEALYQVIGATADISIVHKRGVTGKKPAVFMLPGIMGSNLDDVSKKDRLWLNYIGIVTGGLTKLKIDAANIEAVTLNGQTYNNLINYLSADFDVYPFAYDWRKDLTDTAKLLAKAVRRELENKERTNHEFHFIAHSMGGLLLRVMIHTDPALWKQLTTSKKTKVLMMGVPNEGSYGTIRILLGKDGIIKKIALLDFIHTKKRLLEMFKEYPGLVQLLPKNSEGIFDSKKWKELDTANNEFTAVPTAAVLKKGLDFYKAIENTDYDNAVFRYIAGQDNETPENYFIEKGKINFTSTSQGDGRVLWSTIPSTLNADNIYYVAADHGGIPNLENAFQGFKELLQKGETDQPALSKTKPFSRGADSIQIMPDSDFASIPTDEELNDAIAGGKGKLKKTKGKEIINISVINGDLVHSQYPVVVGHFKGDGIIYAERYLDKALGYKLSEYHVVNNYPGDIGTHLVILPDDAAPDTMICKGGVVAGLGEFGSLTEARLLVTLTQAFLTLAIKVNERVITKTDGEVLTTDFGISALMIGSDFAGLRISTSIKTILMAVLQANEKLDAMSKLEGTSKTYKKINCVELVEIYQHKSIQMSRILKGYLAEDGFSNFKFIPPVITKGSGSLKVIPDENMQDNWHRLEVSVVTKGGGNRRVLPIRFISITDKAHADEETLPANRVMVESLIEKVARHSEWNKEFSQTLFELLIPNEFKGYGSNLRNLVLQVDEETARYPWELLHDANGISDKPMVINTGIIRQLRSGEQRENVIMNNSNRALVIGNPYTDDQYPSLPAAENEALHVSKILTGNGLETTESIGEQDTDIVQKILNKSYKIIHIASHGIVGKTADDPTGVVIGKEMIFTAADFDRIRIVPEFVFINCCSSNEYDMKDLDQMRKKYDLAASVGTQLIQMGVKAAIVTGWEIDDEAAALFSNTIYKKMFEGKSFGEAVRDAREATYNLYGQTNTWGAYQCYGDPFYTFKTAKSGSKKHKFNFSDAEEVIYQLENFISEFTSGSKRKTYEEAQPAVDAIISALLPEWKTDGRIVERLAELYKTLNVFDKALEYYEQLFVLENACYTVKTIEQYYNIGVRNAAALLNAKKITVAAAKTKITAAIKGLKSLKGETIERSSLIAASYKRLFEADRKNDAALIYVAEYYRKAFEYGDKLLNTINYYPYFNWLHFALALSHKKNAHLNIPADIDILSAKALDNARQQNATKPAFYHKTAGASFHIAGLLMAETIADVETQRKAVVKNFKDAWSREGHISDKNSFISHVQVISALLGQQNAKMKLPADKIKALNKIAEDIVKNK